jgi:hypothetical protein
MRKQLVAANLKLTDTQATKFWPIYDQYIAELVKVNNTNTNCSTNTSIATAR